MAIHVEDSVESVSFMPTEVPNVSLVVRWLPPHLWFLIIVEMFEGERSLLLFEDAGLGLHGTSRPPEGSGWALFARGLLDVVLKSFSVRLSIQNADRSVGVSRRPIDVFGTVIVLLSVGAFNERGGWL